MEQRLDKLEEVIVGEGVTGNEQRHVIRIKDNLEKTLKFEIENTSKNQIIEVIGKLMHYDGQFVCIKNGNPYTFYLKNIVSIEGKNGKYGVSFQNGIFNINYI